MVACILPGNDVLSTVDYYDDSEHGAAIRLLEYMESAEITNHALFITRHYDGKHIGPQRFDHIISAAKSAINCKPYNAVNNEFQFSWSRTQLRQKGRGGGMAGGRPLRTQSEVGSDPSYQSPETSADHEVVFGYPKQGQSAHWGDICSSPIAPTQVRSIEMELPAQKET